VTLPVFRKRAAIRAISRWAEEIAPSIPGGDAVHLSNRGQDDACTTYRWQPRSPQCRMPSQSVVTCQIGAHPWTVPPAADSMATRGLAWIGYCGTVDEDRTCAMREIPDKISPRSPPPRMDSKAFVRRPNDNNRSGISVAPHKHRVAQHMARQLPMRLSVRSLKLAFRGKPAIGQRHSCRKQPHSRFLSLVPGRTDT
jgi:hypothetical protein